MFHQQVDDKLHKKLTAAKELIELLCRRAEVPVRIELITLLGEMAWFHAQPVTDPADRLYNGVNAVSQLKTLQKQNTALAYYLNMPRDETMAIFRGRGEIIFECNLRALDLGEYFFPVRLRDVMDICPERNRVVLGKTLDSEFVYVPVDDPRYCHLLVAGMTGSGKTVLANSILYQMVSKNEPSELRVLMASGKVEDVACWEGLPHLLSPPSADPAVALEMLAWAERERKRREQTGQRPYKIVVYLGEISYLVQLNAKRFSDLLQTGAKLMRSENMMLIVATQKPRGDQVGDTVTRSQIPCILCGRMRDPTDSYVALGTGRGNAQRLPGRGAFVTNRGILFQAAYVDEAECRALVSRLKRKFGPQPQIDIVVEKPRLHGGNGTLDADVLTILHEIDGRALTELSQNGICNLGNFGTQRANRVRMALEEMGVFGTRLGPNRGYEIDMLAVEEALRQCQT